MNCITHSLGGVVAGVAVCSVTGICDPIYQAAVMTGAVLGSLLPDIDHRKSWIGHKLPFIASILSGLFKHRGFLHTPLFIFIMWGFLSYAIPIWLGGSRELYEATLFCKGLIPGMLSHLILDTLNVQGIMWFWPVSKQRWHILPIRTGSLGEALVCVALGVMLLRQYNVWI